jgi:multidrug efflux pump subunit AcrA (membrane-fusion protein)
VTVLTDVLAQFCKLCFFKRAGILVIFIEMKKRTIIISLVTISVAVTSGLNAGDQVVTNGQINLTDGVNVSVIRN